ncbi:MAG: DUF2795 domain-containing protein [Thermomicrobiales bacterium]
MDRIKDMAGGFNPADIQQYVQGIAFPVSKDDLLSAVQRNGAPNEMLEKIRGAAIDQFGGVQDVIAAVRG